MSEPEVSRLRPAEPVSPLARALLLLLVVAAALVAFLPVLEAGFVNWDDDVNFTNNPDFRGLGWANLRWMFTTTLMGNWIPLTWLTLGLNYALGGMNPFAYHLVNVLLHAMGRAYSSSWPADCSRRRLRPLCLSSAPAAKMEMSRTWGAGRSRSARRWQPGLRGPSAAC